MDKIVEKLQALGVTAEDLETIKTQFNEAVDARVKAESDLISEKSETFAAARAEEILAERQKELDEDTKKYLEIKTATIAKNAEIKLNEAKAEYRKACEEYLQENLQKGFEELYRKELTLMEDRVIAQLDTYLDYALNECISNEDIKKVAINETYEPLVKGVQHLFENQFVPLNISGRKKLKEAQAQIAQLETMLQESVDKNMKLTDTAEKYAKRALIAEKTIDMNRNDAANVKKFFAEKSFATTKQDIDSYCGMIKESTKRIQEAREQAIRESKVPVTEHRSIVAESTQPKKTVFARPHIEDNTPDYVSERIKSHKESRKRLDESASDNYLTSVAKYCEM